MTTCDGPEEATLRAQAASAKAAESDSRSAHQKAARAHREAAACYPWGHLRKTMHNALVQRHKRQAG